jgi:hypothetical protein
MDRVRVSWGYGLWVAAAALALAACDDEGEQSGGVGVACVPTLCGDEPEHECPNGDLSPIECVRKADGRCSWQVEACPGGSAAAGGRAAGRAGAGAAAGRGGSGAAAGGKSGGAAGRASAAGATAGASGAAAGAGAAGIGAAGTTGAGAAGSSAAGSGGHVGERCGTRGGRSCDPAQFCNFEPDTDCGATDRGGACEDIPQACTTDFMPVCGCDERTYSNACTAHSAGVSVKHDEGCTSDECTSAGGRVETSDGASIPSCEADEESWPLSGGREQMICCVAKSGSGKTCGGIASLMCSGDDFCNFEEAAGGQGCDGTIADAAGQCEPKPSACTREYQPVCSCNTMTFPTACEAHRSGESVMHEGGCTAADCEAIGGHAVAGTGPAPECPPNERKHTDMVGAAGMMPIEGEICCVP